MASLRVSALIAVVAIFACLGSAYATKSREQYCARCAAACGLDYFPKPVYQTYDPKPEYEPSKSVYQTYDPEPEPKPEPVYDPEPEYDPKPPVDHSCEKHASHCDFKFLGVKVPTFELKGRGDNSYDPVILDKYGRIVKVLNANGRCTVFGSGLDCRENFYFKNRKVATRTFNRIPVQEFKGKCIRLEVTSAQLADNSNLNPNDSNYVYPEARRCVVFSTE